MAWILIEVLVNASVNGMAGVWAFLKRRLGGTKYAIDGRCLCI